MARHNSSQPPRNVSEARRLIDGLVKQLREWETKLLVHTEQQASLERKLHLLNSAHEKLAEQALPFLKKRASLQAEIIRVRKDSKYRRMWTSWSGVPTAEGKQIVSDLEAQLVDIQQSLTHLMQQAGCRNGDNGASHFGFYGTPFGLEINECSKQIKDNVASILGLKRAIERTPGEIERARTQLAQLEAREHKRDKDKAFLAQAKGKSRDHAEAIKKQLIKTEECPYCGQPLGEEPHADHIYPQSKGGLSTVKNMAYVCQQCNVRKSDLTLISFIEAFSLDRSRIESALRDLGKDF